MGSSLRSEAAVFEPAIWRAAREQVFAQAQEIIASGEGKLLLILDDNFYYRSMRKPWRRLARERGTAFYQLLLEAPLETCLARNAMRSVEERVPEFSIRHMAEVFESPTEPVCVLDSDALDTAKQVDAVLQLGSALWRRLPDEEEFGPTVPSETHECDVALRRVVSRALAEAPPELPGPTKSRLAKQWSVQKTSLVRQFAEASGEPEDLLHELECAFLRACAEDIRNAVPEL